MRFTSGTIMRPGSDEPLLLANYAAPHRRLVIAHRKSNFLWSNAFRVGVLALLTNADLCSTAVRRVINAKYNLSCWLAPKFFSVTQDPARRSAFVNEWFDRTAFAFNAPFPSIVPVIPRKLLHVREPRIAQPVASLPIIVLPHILLDALVCRT